MAANAGTRILAYVFGAFGAISVVAGAIDTAGVLRGLTGGVPNPVFANARRLPYLETFEHLATSHVANFFIIVGWYVLVVLLAVFFVALLRAVYERAPSATLLAGMFLAGSVISGLLIGTSVLKVGEFAVQAAGVADAEQAWITAGINYLNQVHLFYVSAWLLCIGLGWVFLGAAGRTAVDAAAGRAALDGAARRASLFAGSPLGPPLVLAGGIIVALSVFARSWLPTYGPEAPAFVVAMAEPFATFGFGVGLVGGVLLWRATASGSPKSRSRPASGMTPRAARREL